MVPEAIAKLTKTVTPEKKDVRNSLKILDSGFLRNDKDGVLQLARLTYLFFTVVGQTA